MRKLRLFIIVATVFGVGTNSAVGETIGETNSGPTTYQTRPVYTPRSPVMNSPNNGLSVLQIFKQAMEAPAVNQQDLDSYYKQYYGPGFKGAANGFTPAMDSGPFAQTAQECGEKGQRENSPAVWGNTMCGRAVAQMIRCMAPAIGGSPQCTGACGNGQDFVNCELGQMGACGYTKLDVGDPRCKQAGAVLAMRKSGTVRGNMYGHVEFVCGHNKYCSVYSEPHDYPWPKAPAEACWFPQAKQTFFFGGSR